MNKETKKQLIEIPKGVFCGGNCASPKKCVYWLPNDKDSNDRQRCSKLGKYYYPHERNGCFHKENEK